MLSSYRLYRGNAMRELSIFVDEAGQRDMSDGYYLLTLVLHDQSAPIGEHIEEYEGQLRAGGLPTSRSTWFACSTATGTTTGLTPT